MTAQLTPDSLLVESGTSPEAAIIWTDPVTGHRAYLVIDRLVRGLASGGLRMRPGCTFEEVRQLAAAMSVKEALHYNPSDRYIPMGGAKGGIDCDPAGAAAPGVLYRFLRFIRPYLERNWATGDDLGTSSETIDVTLAALGVANCVAPALRVVDDPVAALRRFTGAFAVTVDGIRLSELVGGCGVAESVLAAMDLDGVDRVGATAVVQGFGTMGGATARFLAEAGLRVVAITDALGTVANPHGLDVEAMLAARLPLGLMDRSKLRAGDQPLGVDAWLDVEADVLVPAATSYCVTEENQHRISARYIVEAANLPVTRYAEHHLAARGTVTLPDVVVNSGTNAWWWWTLFGDVAADAGESFAKVRSSLRALVQETLVLARQEQVPPRQAARLIADARFARLSERLNDTEAA
ncbi:Glu/Leu/Phe/Val dehydrogenase dimerization domain-containing protein [Actinophytocola oryzae]|uniref:Glutamate dehydrogenase n=1 Tax=Actinophytocola oryzae TaxID=502181 RepID=A0A4R7US95_9PSEU|nr:Glu/Leu/Phe/Val dehydrogenase dimerization domain-containing protein [Actinophytocola oryzae]TDV38594.1 glutamate dehydrogenase (NAD(P)+) [Actinophytocola oryzae]